VAYRLGDREVIEFPDDAEELAAVQPVYEELPGWKTDTTGITEFEKLPPLAQAYVRRLEELMGVPVVLISTGPRREETILRRIPPLSGWIAELG
jgi:adenylosuccinate synthase